MSVSQPAAKEGGGDSRSRGSKEKPAPWDTGTVVGGRYKLIGCIGRGAMGEVWRSEHLTLKTHVAIKLVDASSHKDGDEILERFRLEGQAAGRIRSPHVVQIFDYGTENDIAYMAMELLEGETLSDRLTRAGKFSLADTARVMHEIALGVGQAHEHGIVHRDLKPQNVFLAKLGGRIVVKVLDFGIAKLTAAAPTDTLKTHAGMMVGTPAYMSPEQVMGNTAIDWRSDLWQMGIIAFECACGKMPFDATSLGDLFMRICSAPLPVPSKMAPVPEVFDVWFARAMQRDPERRFQSAREMSEALAALVPHGTARKTTQSEVFRQNVSASPWGSSRDAQRQQADSKRIVLIAAIAALSTALLVSGAIYLLTRDDDSTTETMERSTQGASTAESGAPATTGAPAPEAPAQPPKGGLKDPTPQAQTALPMPTALPSVSPTGAVPETTSAPATPSVRPTSPKSPQGSQRAEDVFGI